MFSHIMLGVSDLEKSKTFYDAILGALGIPPGNADGRGRVFWSNGTANFAITQPINGQPASAGNGETIGFAAASKEQADAWHAAGCANGGTSCEDPPGVRGSGTPMAMYLAYLRDPDGHKLCVLKFGE
jgi:catechol 2,3-dioxygenase-like lactoylglutathione lyase family enzyme